MASPDTVLYQINDLNKWKNWYPGFDTIQMLPVEMENGAVLSMKIPRASVVLMQRKKDEIVAEFRQNKKKPVISGWKVISYPQTDSITIQWYLDFKLRWYPWEKFSSLLYEKMYGTQMEKGLTDLKKIVEANRSSNN